MSLGASIAGREAELAELRGLLDVFKLCPQVRARGYRVLEAAPVESESSFGYAVLPVDGGSRAAKERALIGRYAACVSSPRVPGGVVHRLPTDLRKALIANSAALDAWNDITPLARNEFICWVEDAKQKLTRERRIRRTQEELEEGQRRPCCWPGCRHRERNGR